VATIRSICIASSRIKRFDIYAISTACNPGISTAMSRDTCAYPKRTGAHYGKSIGSAKPIGITLSGSALRVSDIQCFYKPTEHAAVKMM